MCVKIKKEKLKKKINDQPQKSLFFFLILNNDRRYVQLKFLPQSDLSIRICI